MSMWTCLLHLAGGKCYNSHNSIVTTAIHAVKVLLLYVYIIFVHHARLGMEPNAVGDANIHAEGMNEHRGM